MIFFSHYKMRITPLGYRIIIFAIGLAIWSLLALILGVTIAGKFMIAILVLSVLLTIVNESK